MNWWSLFATLAYVALATAAIISVLRHRKDPANMLAWVVAILGFPYFGAAFYYLIGSPRVERRARRKLRRVRHLHQHLRGSAARSAADAGEVIPASELPPHLTTIQQFGERLSAMPATSGNRIAVSQDAETTYAALEEAIRGAREHIHLAYYIWRGDETGAHFRDLLIEKARAGVRVRVLLDAVGCWRLSRAFLKPWHESGCDVQFFLPLRPFRRRRWSTHLRNHRKIAVVDGRVGFVGSQNIGDEYRGWKQALSPWFDTHLRIEGPAALFLQQVFVDDWAFTTKRPITDPALFPATESQGDARVQILPTGPTQDFSPLEQLTFAAVAHAEHTLRIETPYFVPYDTLRNALLYAVHRGVRVVIVVPTRTDVPVVTWAGRSYYRELTDAGIEVYEYEGGVLHSKIMTVDDAWCMVGTANMDIRSFRLNFEVTALIYDGAITCDLARAIDANAGAARRIPKRRSPGYWRQVGEGAARLLSPIL